MHIQGKVAVITGAAQGIGRRVAEMLVDKGAFVVIGDVKPAGAQVASDLNKASSGGSSGSPVAAFHPCDVRQSSDLSALIATALKTFGRLDIFVNNAGVSGSFLWADTDDTEVSRAIDVNLKAPIEGTRQAVRHFLQQGIPGCVVNVASMAAFAPLEFGPAYAASKAGLVAFNASCATLALREPAIRVNAVAPTFVDTDLTSQGVPEDIRAILQGAGESTVDTVALQVLRCIEDEQLAGDTIRIRSEECISLHDGPKARPFGFVTAFKI
ncbi:hypothetical protein GGI15_004597 [Coemansia interrupta]|uniref:Uncharacterized protein n=1 Tax=Coemansia interrupta TaxID=1126814 RepID=A0A9W8H6F8_9FUNG|nr:hypothetical protein GGI15_004597 [Coemansia interrupta]